MNSNHHAELVLASSVMTCVPACIPENTEVSEITSDKFGIDDARELVKRAHNRPVQSEELTLVVRAEFITHEAQNALLKVLEEPPLSTRFVFIVPPDFIFLSTLRSRLNESSEESVEESIEAKEAFKIFLKSDYKDRLSAIESASKNKDASWQRLIKQGLIYYVKNDTLKNKSLVGLEYVARTLLTRGASNKMLLEHAALIL